MKCDSRHSSATGGRWLLRLANRGWIGSPVLRRVVTDTTHWQDFAESPRSAVNKVKGSSSSLAGRSCRQAAINRYS